jgi:hypothetical protein
LGAVVRRARHLLVVCLDNGGGQEQEGRASVGDAADLGGRERTRANRVAR